MNHISLYALKFKEKGKGRPYKTALVLAESEHHAISKFNWVSTGHYDVDLRTVSMAGDSCPIAHDYLVLNVPDIEEIQG